MFKLYAFDLDGTLCDTISDLSLAANLLRQHYQLNILSEEKIASFVGKGIKVLVARLLQEKALPEAELEKANQIFLQFYEQHLCDNSKLYPQVIETLKILKERDKNLIVITNKNEALAVKLLQALKIHDYFTLIYGGDTFLQRKPNPYPLLIAQQYFNFSAADCLMIGDSDNDVMAAKNAHWRSAFYKHGYQHGEQPEADFYYGNFVEILTFK